MIPVEQFRQMTPEQKAALEPGMRQALEQIVASQSAAPGITLTPNQDVVIPPSPQAVATPITAAGVASQVAPQAIPTQQPAAEPLTYAQAAAVGLEPRSWYQFWKVHITSQYDIAAMIAGGLIVLGVVALGGLIYAICRKTD